MVRIAIVGCGNIAHIIYEKSKNVDIVAVYDIDEKRANDFAEMCHASMKSSIDELIAAPVDLIVEAASPQAVSEIGKKVLSNGKDFMIMSVGGLADTKIYNELVLLAKKNDRTIHIPSGAIGGLDAIRAAQIGIIESITLETTKPPSSLGMDVDTRTVVFEGSPQDAIKKYPKNINVAVTLSLISDTSPVLVRIVADPAYTKNVHMITVKGDVGKMMFTFDNNPSENKATSLLAGYSAVSLLDSLSSVVRF